MAEITKTREQVIAWLKAAKERQENWQKEVRQRWTERQAETSVAL